MTKQLRLPTQSTSLLEPLPASQAGQARVARNGSLQPVIVNRSQNLMEVKIERNREKEIDVSETSNCNVIKSISDKETYLAQSNRRLVAAKKK